MFHEAARALLGGRLWVCVTHNSLLAGYCTGASPRNSTVRLKYFFVALRWPQIKCLLFPRICFIITVMSTVSLQSMVPEIGKILRLFREKINKNQGDVADKAGISTSMLSQIEREQCRPPSTR